MAEALADRLESEGASVSTFRGLACDSNLLEYVARRAAGGRTDATERFLVEYIGWSLAHNAERARALVCDVLIADRFLLDYWANQYAFGHDLDELTWVAGLMEPADVTVHVRLDATLARARIAARGDGVAWQDGEYFERVTKGFEAGMAALPAGTLLELAGERPVKSWVEEVWRCMRQA